MDNGPQTLTRIASHVSINLDQGVRTRACQQVLGRSAILPGVNHDDHVALLRGGVPQRGGTWADLGCGSGAFTLALAELLGPKAVIYAVDLDNRALSSLRQRFERLFPARDIRPIAADFARPLGLPALDGVVMANSLHFHQEKEPIVRSVHQMLRENGRLILVEYNVDRGNRWVPFPISYPHWRKLALECGFTVTELLLTKPTSFLREVYSAVST